MIGGPARIVTGAATIFCLLHSEMNLDFSSDSNLPGKAQWNSPWTIWAIGFIISLAPPCPLSFGQTTETEQPWANVTGQIVIEGTLPEIPAERVGSHKDRPVCLVDGEVPPDDQLVVDPDGGLRDVFVILTPVETGVAIPVHSSYRTATSAALQMDNLKCRFVPHAMAVTTGQTVRLTNSDSVGHNCKIFSINNEHNINLPAGGEAEIKLDSADRVPANVTCDIHPWMDAVILAKEHPYVAITSVDGTFEMKNVPTGQWKLQFWHQRFGFLRKLEAAKMKVDRRARITVQFEPDQTLELGKMTLPISILK